MKATIEQLAATLETALGSGSVTAGASALASYNVDGKSPAILCAPKDQDEVGAALRLCAEARAGVIPWGGGTAMRLGNIPRRADVILELKRLNKLIEHDDANLTASAQAGIKVADLQQILGRQRQFLPVEPPRPELATIGGTAAANINGPRRIVYGGVRDLVIGMKVVLAEGQQIKAGGKVVKNVAGYDLPKLFIGAFGTLGVVVEATVKLRPRPDADRLVVARFGSLKEAGAAARAIMSSDLLPSALDLVDGETLRALGLGGPDGAALLIGVDGIPEQVGWQCAEVERLLRLQGLVDARVLDGDARDAAWRARGGLGRGAFTETAAVMKWVVLPAQVADVMEQGAAAAQRAGLPAALAAHAGVGVVEAVLAGGRGGDATAIAGVLTEWRRLVRTAGGQALVESAPLAVKERVPVWDDPGPALRIMQRIKSQLDPAGLLNPGRFVGGI